MTSSPTHRKDFVLWLGNADNVQLTPSIPEISIIQEPNGKEYLCFEENIKEIGRSREFHNRWHTLKVLSDYSNERISIFLDDRPLLKNLFMSPNYQINRAISFSTAPCDTIDVEIDDLIIRIFYYTERVNSFITLFTEDFESFEQGRFPENSGWIKNGIISQKNDQTTFSEAIFISRDSISGLKTLILNPVEDNQVIVVKQFNIPGSYPFDVSDRPFKISYNKDMETIRSQESVISDQEKLSGQLPVCSGQAFYDKDYFEAFSTFDYKNSHGPNTGSHFDSTGSTKGFGSIKSTSLVDTYYIYSFDGKLLAEYDHDGNCVRDYIYLGSQLIAEYRPNVHIPDQDEEYYYYMTDQINSTRIITDENGDVVYSASYSPFGEVQKVWINTYDPKLKFSGKEREEYSELDYFGARYYDHNSYRFISVDPIINKKEALENPQLWNLYSYCRNNPITYLDPDGNSEADIRAIQYMFNSWIRKQTRLKNREGRGYIGGIVNNVKWIAQNLGISKGKLQSCEIQSDRLRQFLVKYISDRKSIDMNFLSHKVDDDWNFNIVGGIKTKRNMWGLHWWILGKSSIGETVIIDPLFNQFDAFNGKWGNEWKKGAFRQRKPRGMYNHVY